MKVIFKTDRGKLRDHNEDNGDVLIKEERVLAVVADGMGGAKAGEEASALAVQTIQKAWEEYEPSTSEAEERWLEETVLQANRTIFEFAQAHPECKGMGTTIVAALCHPNYFIIANVGDSRGYLVGEGAITQITEDHSLVNELVKAGQLSEEDAVHHPRKNVLMRAVGTDLKTQVDLYRQDWQPYHSLLLCSDGLSNLVTSDDMLSIINSEISFEDKADELIRRAIEAGGNDNITVTLVLNDGGEAQ